MPKAYDPEPVEERWYATLGGGRLVPSRGQPRRRAVLHRDPAAQRHRLAAHGPRLRALADRRHHPPEADAGLRRPLAAGHRPRRHRHPERGRAGAGQGGPRPPRDRPRGLRRAGLGLEGRAGRPHHPADAEDGLVVRLEPRALHDGRGLLPGRPGRLRAALRRGPHLPGQPDHQLVPPLPHRAVRHRGRARGRRRRARPHPLPVRRRRRVDHRGHHPGRDDAGRHRRWPCTPTTSATPAPSAAR